MYSCESDDSTFICNGYSTGISVCEMWEVRAGVQVSMREFHTHIHLGYARIDSILYKKKIQLTISSIYNKYYGNVCDHKRTPIDVPSPKSQLARFPIL